MSLPALRREVLETFIPLNSLPAERLDYLLQDVRVWTLAPDEVIAACREGSGQTVFLLSGTLQIWEAGTQVASISAGEVQSWYPITTPRSGLQSVVAEATVNCIVIDSGKLDYVLAWEQSARYFEAELAFDQKLSDSRWLRRLLQAPIFYQLPPAHVRELFRRMQEVDVVAGQWVIKQGDVADACYFIRQGIAEVLVEGEDRSERSLALLEAGQYFGEDGLLLCGSRNASVRMETAGSLLRLGKDDFAELLQGPLVEKVDWSTALDMVAQGARWLDVRLTEECPTGVLPGALNVPLQNLRVKGRLLDKSATYIAYCDSGLRSTAATFLLRAEGYQVSALAQGLRALDAEELAPLLTPRG